MSNKEEAKNVQEETKHPLKPRLRFPEFRDAGAWDKKPLGSLCSLMNNLRQPISSDNRQKGIYPYYGASGIVDFVNDFIFNERLLLIGEDGAKWGAFEKTAFIVEGKYWVNNHAHVLKVNKVNDTFLENYLNMVDLGPYITGAAPPKLTLGKLKEIIIPVPGLVAEQQCIADCLASLDDLIAAHTDKLDALKLHKKGLMQQLFPAEGETVPRLRFPEFRDAGEWEEKKLGNVATFFKGKGLPKSVIEPNGKYPCVHYGELFTDYPEVIEKVKSYTNSEDDVFLSVENDVLMPTSDVTPNGPAKASCINLDNVILGGDILVIRTSKQEVNGEFLARYIRHVEQKVLQLVSGTTVFHLYATSIDKLALSFPSRQEQQRIADCLAFLDDLIAAQSDKIQMLKDHKKGLMQQLFPAPDEVQA